MEDDDGLEFNFDFGDSNSLPEPKKKAAASTSIPSNKLKINDGPKNSKNGTSAPPSSSSSSSTSTSSSTSSSSSLPNNRKTKSHENTELNKKAATSLPLSSSSTSDGIDKKRKATAKNEEDKKVSNAKVQVIKAEVGQQLLELKTDSDSGDDDDDDGDDDDQEDEEEKIEVKRTSKQRKVISFEDDPMQYHAKPRDLGQNSILKRPRESSSKTLSSHIFSRTPFSSLSLDKRLIELLEKKTIEGGLGIPITTRVQSVVLPLQLEQRRNMLIKSQTGSGKTLTFLLPMLHDLMTLEPSLQRSDGTRALVVAPTRELCGQIADVLGKVTKCCVWIVGGSITGGEKRKSEKARLRKGIVVLVGTPGRLLDHLRTTEAFNLSRLRWVILDEADRLLDMGFEQTILESLSIIRGVRLPGLKEKEERGNGNGNGNGGSKGIEGGNLQKRWSQQNAAMAKRCTEMDDLIHVMASATLTKAVKQLAAPVMGGASFLVIDADRESVVDINDVSDLANIGAGVGGKQDKGLIVFGDEDDPGFDNKVDKSGTISFDGDDDDQDKKRFRHALEKGEQLEAPAQLQQYYMMVTCKWRLAALLSFLKSHSHQKVIVFFVTCDSVDYHALLLRETDWPVELDEAIEEPKSTEKGQRSSSSSASSSSSSSSSSLNEASVKHYIEPLSSKFTGMFGDKCNLYRLHGNVPQKVRQTVYKEFCAADRGILLCTDVAARGLDLPKVDWILQYDPPCETTDYVHRIGRTARRGLGGSALLFLLPSEGQYVQLLHSHNLHPEQLSLQSMFFDAAKEIPGSQKFKNRDEMAAVILQRRLENVVFSNKYLTNAGKQAFRSFVRAYATHSADTKGIFRVKLLHLGHVAKSFGLRENPKANRFDEDVIGKIFNGEFSSSIFLDREAKQKARDEKYALSRPKKGDKHNKDNDRGEKDKKKGNASSSSSSPSPSSSSSPSAPSSGGSLPPQNAIKRGNDRQKLRKVGKASNLAPSGKFRKSKDGYFRKKMSPRAAALSEFSS